MYFNILTSDVLKYKYNWLKAIQEKINVHMFNVFSFFSPFKFKIFFVFLGLKYEHSNLNVILSIDS